MKNIKMIIQYDGSRYSGWQRVHNGKTPSIQEKMEDTFTKYFGEAISIHASGRTDKGAHALGQVINFITHTDKEIEEIHWDLNQFLPEDISIIESEVINGRFHARLNAVEKTYRYHLWIGANKPVFNRKYVMVYDGPAIDMERMNRAKDQLIGSHDFIGFSSDKTKKGTVREVREITITETEDEIIFDMTGNGFLYNMVRILVGTLIDVGNGMLSEEAIQKTFETGRREFAGRTVHADGLFLLDVKY